EGRKRIRELHKKDDPILWDGHLARPNIISRQDACTTRNFGVFFYLEVSNWKLIEFVGIGVADFDCEYSATFQNLS
ncbi:hypothetical protein MEN24_05060, partial [Dolichospermum sp. ST_sed10]|nr:hypothetical protein [Dolichospermum sp. ST_sed10]